VPPIGFHASHEQHRPSTLLAYVQQAEDSLFETASADVAERVERIQVPVDLGFDEILLHNVHRDQETFIRDFAEHVLPNLDR
jgi:coenzyme F420-dependent glucose-6-phosphate dehydrogenase